MALVGLGIISILKCKRHCKSCDIGESCTKRTELAQKMMIDELRWIITTSEWVYVCCTFLCTFHEVSLKIASLVWGSLETAGYNSQTTSVHITHTFSSFLCCYTHPICVQQHNTNETCVICTGVVWLGSPATIALSMLRANEATCKLTAWDILIPIRVLLVIWCVLINW